MTYQALARKWRPKTFDQVIGQPHVVSALGNGLDNRRVHHAFLFAGTRGVGKTTLARIFAKALNCEQGVSSTPCGECVACRGVDRGNFIDLIEVDAASRTKVDDTRELLDNVQYTPTQGRYKIYLIDEVHMLSTHSFNALLKTLEEPPEHVKFLLATTDPQKLPTTILSRCIQFNLKAMDMELIIAQLEKILRAEEVEFDAAALTVLARSANGSVRDALSLLDQGIAFGNGEVREEKIRAMLGMIDDAYTHELLAHVAADDAAAALQTVAAMARRSVDFAAALDEILTALHNIALLQVDAKAVEWKGVDAAELAKFADTDAELLQLWYQIALIGKRDLAQAPDPRSGFEMVLLRMIAFSPARGDAPNARPAAKPAAVKQTAAEAKPAAQPATKTPRPATPAEPPAGDAAAGAKADVATEKLPPAKLTESKHWAKCGAQIGGLPGQLMMQMVPEKLQDDILHLTLDAEHSHLLTPPRIARIEQQLAGYLQSPVKLKVGVGAAGVDTPRRQQARADAESQSNAKREFQNDPMVRELVEMFDGEVVDASIQSPTSQPQTAEKNP